MSTKIVASPFSISNLNLATIESKRVVAILVSDRGYRMLYSRLTPAERGPIETVLQTNGFEVSIKRLGTLQYNGIPVIQVDMQVDCMVVGED